MDQLAHTRVRLHEDVLYAIFEQLAVPDGAWFDYDVSKRLKPPGGQMTEEGHRRAVNKATLARCARVCRAFFEPAVSVLWRDLDDLEAVFALDRCEDASAKGSTPPEASQLAVSSPARRQGQASLHRRARYLAHVRTVHKPAQRVHGSLPPVLPGLPLCYNYQTHLSAALFESSLRLTRLRWVQEVPEEAGDAHYDPLLPLLSLLSPSLRSLHIIFTHPHIAARAHRPSADREHRYQTFVETLLAAAAAHAPNLTYLRCTRTSRIPEPWLHPICRFARLETLDLLEPTQDVLSDSSLLRSLAALPCLRTLSVHLRPGCPTQPADYTSADSGPLALAGGFPALRVLHLKGSYTSLDAALGLVRAVSSPFFETLHVEGFECKTDVLGSMLRDLCTLLHTRFRRTLRELVVSLYGLGPSGGLDSGALLVDPLEPVAKIRGMRDVRLSLAPQGESLTLCEKDLKDMAEGSPVLGPRIEADPLSLRKCQ